MGPVLPEPEGDRSLEADCPSRMRGAALLAGNSLPLRGAAKQRPGAERSSDFNEWRRCSPEAFRVARHRQGSEPSRECPPVPAAASKKKTVPFSSAAGHASYPASGPFRWETRLRNRCRPKASSIPSRSAFTTLHSLFLTYTHKDCVSWSASARGIRCSSIGTHSAKPGNLTADPGFLRP